MDDRFSMKGRNAIVTGATRGIGLAIAHELGRAGAKVADKPDGYQRAVQNWVSA